MQLCTVGKHTPNIHRTGHLTQRLTAIHSYPSPLPHNSGVHCPPASQACIHAPRYMSSGSLSERSACCTSKGPLCCTLWALTALLPFRPPKLQLLRQLTLTLTQVATPHPHPQASSAAIGKLSPSPCPPCCPPAPPAPPATELLAHGSRPTPPAPPHPPHPTAAPAAAGQSALPGCPIWLHASRKKRCETPTIQVQV